MSEELTVRKVAQDLRLMASELVVDNGGYGDRLRSIAGWIDRTFEDHEHYKRETVRILSELATLKEQVASQQAKLDELQADLDDDET